MLQSISQAWLPGFYLELSLRRLGTWRQSRTTASRRERTSFYRFKELYDKGGEAALIELSRQRPNIRNRAAAEVEQAVLGLAVEQPAWGQLWVANQLARNGITISASGVRSIWQRHDLATMRQRLKALEAKVAQDGLILTEAQLAALEKAKQDKEAHGEFESVPARGAQRHLSRLLRGSGHFLRRHAQGRRAHLPADLH